jgi:hypothetical protein
MYFYDNFIIYLKCSFKSNFKTFFNSKEMFPFYQSLNILQFLSVSFLINFQAFLNLETFPNSLEKCFISQPRKVPS